MQSKVFQAAYHSHQNLLVCAPTGAGKTNVAMLTMMRLVKDYLTQGKVNAVHHHPGLLHLNSTCFLEDGQRTQIKAIYIAPMKALAQEVVTKFGQRLAPLALEVSDTANHVST
jgi:activating signal cointegrator complex subunit 3